MATATAVLDIGAVPVFADIDPHTYTLDPASAVACVIHVRGRSSRCIQEAVRLIWTPSWPEHRDTISSSWKARPKSGERPGKDAWWGPWAISAASFSFQSSKNITAGAGGIMLANAPTIAALPRSLSKRRRRQDGPWYAHYA